MTNVTFGLDGEEPETIIVPGDTGPAGPTGPGVAEGGTTGQHLAKESATDFDTDWEDPPTGGGLDNVVDDTTPQLGGNLDTQTFTVDGRDVSTDGAKLDNIESNATADQTGAEIKVSYEAEANTNAFTDAEQTKLSGIETAATADQTDAEIKTAYEANSNTNAFTDAEQTKLTGIETAATADQTGAEIKVAYEGEANTNAFTDALQAKLNSIDAAHYLPPVQSTANLTAITEASLTDKARVYVEDDVSDYFYDATAVSGDFAPDDQTGGTGFWKRVETAGESAASIKAKYESNADTNAFTDTEKSKLSGIEASATADQSDSEIKTAYENNANTNAFTDANSSKLAGIESSATADQTGAEIKVAYEGEANTNAYTDTEKTKLGGIETGAEVNVAVPVQDDEVEIVADPSAINFKGAGVVVADVGGVATVTVAGGGGSSGILIVRQEEAANTGGGASIVGTQIRDLNIVNLNTLTGASLSSKQITLAAGTYDVDAFAAGHSVSNHRISLFNVTDTSIEALGMSGGFLTGIATGDLVRLSGRFTIAATKVFELRHFTSAVKGNGLGVVVNDGNVEIYVQVTIREV